MKTLYDSNGLVFWDEPEIELRNTLIRYFAAGVAEILLGINRAWLFRRIEAPILTPRPLVNPNYGDGDLWTSSELVLRPETTMGSYAAARQMLAEKGGLMPFCVWQAGKSFRKEQDKTLSNMRLKEFYQLEFQCLFAESTKADYQELVMEPLAVLLADAMSRETRVVPSDRLPDYSLKTLDVEAFTGERWMEVCSVSLRKDFAEGIRVLEIAIGLDRCVYLRRSA